MLVKKSSGLMVEKSRVEGIADVGGSILNVGVSVLVMRGLGCRALTSSTVKGGTKMGINRVSFLLGEAGLTARAGQHRESPGLHACVPPQWRDPSQHTGSSSGGNGGGVFGGRVDDGAGERRGGSHGGHARCGRVGIGKYPRLLIP